VAHSKRWPLKIRLKPISPHAEYHVRFERSTRGLICGLIAVDRTLKLNYKREYSTSSVARSRKLWAYCVRLFIESRQRMLDYGSTVLAVRHEALLVGVFCNSFFSASGEHL